MFSLLRTSFIYNGALVQASITAYHRLNGLNKKRLLLTVQEAGKSKISVLEYLMSGEGLLPGS